MTVRAVFEPLLDSIGSNQQLWMCTLTSTDATKREVRIERFAPPGAANRIGTKPKVPVSGAAAVPVLRGDVVVTEHDAVANTATEVGRTANASGTVTFRLKGTPVQQANQFRWSLTLSTRVDLGVTLVASVADDQGAFQEAGRTVNSTFVPAQLNTSTPLTIVAQVKPVPRLSVGLNQVTVPPIPPKYRGFTQGSGDLSTLNASNMSALGALLYRIFFLLDAPGTLDAVWDSESGRSAAALAAKTKAGLTDVADAEEVWARQVAEMLVGVPYDSPMNAYNVLTAAENAQAKAQQGRPKGAAPQPGDVPAKFTNMPFCGASVVAGSSNPFYGLLFACQHLATFGILSRGEHGPSGEIAAASGASVTVTRMKRSADGAVGKWFVDADSPREISAGEAATTDDDPKVLTPSSQVGKEFPVDIKKMIALPDYGPGAVHLFSNGFLPAEDVAAYDEMDAFVTNVGIDPKTKKLKSPHADGFGAKFIPAVKAPPDPAAGQPITNQKKVQLRNLMKIRITSNVVTRTTTLCYPAPLGVERDNQGAAHIGFTLRVRNERVQFLDTGGLNAPNRETPEERLLFPKKDGMHGGTMDDALGTACKSLGAPFRGVGVFGRLQPDKAQQLVNHVNNVLKRARPIGFARLYVLDQGTLPSNGAVDITKVRYASPLKPMYDTGTGTGNGKASGDPSDFNLLEHNYSLVRYAWSLRGLSVAQQIDAVWVFYAPFRTLADKMIKASHTTELTADTDESLVRHTQVVRGCMSRPDGSVTFLFKESLFPLTRLEGRSAQPLANQPDTIKFDPKLPFGRAFRDDVLPPDIPRYFRNPSSAGGS